MDRMSSIMHKFVIGVLKIILTVIFFININNIINFLVDLLLPTSQEVPGVILIYLLIFILEIILAFTCTNLVFKLIRKEGR